MPLLLRQCHGANPATNGVRAAHSHRPLILARTFCVCRSVPAGRTGYCTPMAERLEHANVPGTSMALVRGCRSGCSVAQALWTWATSALPAAASV